MVSDLENELWLTKNYFRKLLDEKYSTGDPCYGTNLQLNYSFTENFVFSPVGKLTGATARSTIKTVTVHITNTKCK